MGSGTFNPHEWDAYRTTTAHKTTKGVGGIYKRSTLKPELDPRTFKVRESRDSVDNPQSTPIIVALDVTGSMNPISDKIAREGLGILFNEILSRKPVTNPHLMFMGFGDVAARDPAPLQVSQFEADNRIVDQLTDIWLVGGGGNDYESYHLPLYFAAMHTSIDSIEKRKKKGYLFTLGDESVPKSPLTPDHIETVFGYKSQVSLSYKQCLEMASRMYECFHLVTAQGNHGSRFFPRWQEEIGQRALLVEDYTKIAEVIVSTIQVMEGDNVAAVVDSWDPDTSIVVKRAVGSLVPADLKKLGAVKL